MNLCPRCEHFEIREVGALSRTDNKTYICSSCGLDEAINAFVGKDLPHRLYWPIDLEARRET